MTVNVEISADSAKALMEYDKLVQKNKELKRELKEAAKASKELDSGMEEAGKTGGDSMQLIASGITGVTMAAGAALQIMREMAASADEAANKIKETKAERADLATLARNQGDMRSLEYMSNQLSNTFGLEQDEARRLMFDARSLGYDPSQTGSTSDLMSIGRAASVMGFEQVAPAGKLRQLFQDEGRSIGDVIAGSLIASGESPATFSDIFQGLPKAAEGTKQSGATMAETMAAVSALAHETDTPFTAANRVRAFASRMALNPELRGQSLVAQYDVLAGMSEDERNAILGNSQEMQGAYSMIGSQRQTILDRTAMIEAGYGGGRIDELVSSNLGAGASFAEWRARQARIRREISTQDTGASRLVNRANFDQFSAEAQQLANEDGGMRGNAIRAVDAAANIGYDTGSSVGLGNFAGRMIESYLTGGLLDSSARRERDRPQPVVIQNQPTMAAPDVDK